MSRIEELNDANIRVVYNDAGDIESLIDDKGRALNIPLVSKDVTGKVKKIGGTRSALLDVADTNVGQAMPSRRTAAYQRVTGDSNNATGDFTLHQTRQAPGEYDAIQITVHGKTSSANAFKVSIAPSASYNNGYSPVDSAGSAVAWTPVTFGTTDRMNPRNPGGGSATAVVSNASGSVAADTLIEGDVPSDIISLSSLPRTDYPTRNPLLMARLFGTNPPGQLVSRLTVANKAEYDDILPDFYAGYRATTDYTASEPPGAFTGGWLPGISITYYLKGKAVYNVGVAGDSIEMGWIPAAASNQFGGTIKGWPRRFLKALVDAGENISYYSIAYQGDKAHTFLQRAINAIYSGHLTHLVLKPWSVNQTADGDAGVKKTIALTTKVINLAISRGIVPIVIQPWGGQGNGTSMRTLVDAYIASLKAAGVRVFDARSVTDDGTGALATAYRIDYDTIHPNAAGQQAVADYAIANRDTFLL